MKFSAVSFYGPVDGIVEITNVIDLVNIAGTERNLGQFQGLCYQRQSHGTDVDVEKRDSMTVIGNSDDIDIFMGELKEFYIDHPEVESRVAILNRRTVNI